MQNVLTSVISLSKKVSLTLFAFALFVSTAFGQHEAAATEGHAAEEKFKPGEMIMHHISDAHQIHIIGDIHIPLPIILYHEGHLEVFSSSNFWDGHEHGHLKFKPYTASSGITYENRGEKIVVYDPKAPKLDAHGHPIHEVHAAAPVDTTVHTETHVEGQMTVHHAEDTTSHAEVAPVAAEDHGHEVKFEHVKPMDFSITKSVFGMLFVIVLMLIIFRSVASSYKKRKGMAPTGMQNLFEPFILFIRNEVAIPSIGKKRADAFVPFLLTTFFFIWMCNMLGLIPFIGGFNITGTMSITLVLAAIVFIITSVNGNKHYWGHIFWPPGVPLPIKFILVPIEIMSLFIKPTVLMIRLTANITAGHIIILAFVGLVLLFGQNSAVAGYSIGVGAVLFMVFMFFIELLVAFLQAYVFTLLAALYFGDATQEHHHEEDHH
jgi:F-type H+-transporting ATPase subunit a